LNKYKAQGESAERAHLDKPNRLAAARTSQQHLLQANCAANDVAEGQMETTKPFQHIRLLILGPRLPERRALDQLLAPQTSIVIVGEVLEIAKTAESARPLKPDVILLHSLGVEFALEAIRVILSQLPHARLLVVTQAMSADEAVLMLEHGALGLLPAGDIYAQGLRAIHAVHAGEIWGSRALLSRIVHGSIKHTTLVHAHEKSSLSLTERESEIIKLLRSGSSNKEIAAQLQISDKTVKTHLQNIFGKLHIHRRQQILPALLS
jgi:DNA-binding NarL/FixJ family response regulator